MESVPRERCGLRYIRTDLAIDRPSPETRTTSKFGTCPTASIENAEGAYKAAFGADADTTDLHASILPAMLASLLGFAGNEIGIES